MSKLKEQYSFETTFGVYRVDEIIGEGGSGRVYGGTGPDNESIALKVLAAERASADKRRRFKNEIGFLLRNKHSNIVTVLDHGIAQSGKITGPFYIMNRFDGNLRGLINGTLEPREALTFFSQILDGVEAAHLQGVIHRDVKPENILFDARSKTLAVADFGIARFAEDQLITQVKTLETQRLANFQYAAPEQRTAGSPVSEATDIYALGLILNEMFTRVVPHGTDYKRIGAVSGDFAFLDPIVDQMLRQTPADRPRSIGEVKGLIQRHRAEAVSLQKLSKIRDTVVKSTEVDDPLALESPRLIDADWEDGTLTLTLDRSVTEAWVRALYDMGNYTSVMGVEPETFSFRGNKAIARVDASGVQSVIDFFKQWLPKATQRLKYNLERAAAQNEAQRKHQLRQQQQAEEERLRVLRSIKI